MIRVKYSYIVDSDEYFNSGIANYAKNHYSAEFLVESYSKNDEIKVYYNPDKPQHSTLIKHKTDYSFFILFEVFFLFILIISIVALIQENKRQNKKTITKRKLKK